MKFSFGKITSSLNGTDLKKGIRNFLLKYKALELQISLMNNRLNRIELK